MVNMGEIFAHTRLRAVPMDRVQLTPAEQAASLLQPGDLLFARQSLVLEGAGKCTIFLEDAENVCFESHIIRCRVDKALANPLFYFYLFQSLSGKQLIESIVEQGAGAAGVRGSDLARIMVPYPNIDLQNEYAALLTLLDDKTELNRQICATLEEIARTIFQSWFVNFDPVRAKVQANAEGLDPERAAMSALSGKADAELDALAGETFASLAATSALFPDSFAGSQAGQIPAGWTVEPLDQVADFLNGLALQKYPPNEGESLPVIKIAQLKKGGVEGADRASAQIPANFIVNDGDVLFSWSGSLEVDVWCGGRGALNQHLFKVTSARFPKWFYYHWTRQHLSHFKAIASGKAVTMGHIQRHHLTQALCIVPPSDLLTRVTAILQPLLDMQIANRLQNRQLQIIRDTLLPKLISGELPVSPSAGE